MVDIRVIILLRVFGGGRLGGGDQSILYTVLYTIHTNTTCTYTYIHTHYIQTRVRSLVRSSARTCVCVSRVRCYVVCVGYSLNQFICKTNLYKLHIHTQHTDTDSNTNKQQTNNHKLRATYTKPSLLTLEQYVRTGRATY